MKSLTNTLASLGLGIVLLGSGCTEKIISTRPEAESSNLPVLIGQPLSVASAYGKISGTVSTIVKTRDNKEVIVHGNSGHGLNGFMSRKAISSAEALIQAEIAKGTNGIVSFYEINKEGYAKSMQARDYTILFD
ncbi:hypothetical protein KA107_01935 [Candidatus Pacearchaeota archaeon]|nr:hypothetical protein [Candidatus Pacearchaeota archaeon]